MILPVLSSSWVSSGIRWHSRGCELRCKARDQQGKLLGIFSLGLAESCLGHCMPCCTQFCLSGFCSLAKPSSVVFFRSPWMPVGIEFSTSSASTCCSARRPRHRRRQRDRLFPSADALGFHPLVGALRFVPPLFTVVHGSGRPGTKC